jgi:putative acetyltransferase
MTIADYEAVIALWQASAGVGLSKADSREAIGRYLARNPGLSQVAWVSDEEPSQPVLAGAVLCGHDGRRGFIHHLAVRAENRRGGLGRALVERCLSGLAEEGIDKCHLFVFASNTQGREFWLGCGWRERPELVIMSAEVDLGAGD